MEQERGRRLRRHLQFVGKVFHQFRVRIASQQALQGTFVGVGRGERNHRIAEHQKVGPAAYAVDGVGGAGIAGVEVRAGGGGQVAAGRKAHDADAVGRDAVFGGLVADGTDGALGI